jgi:hypothetical protein
MTSEQEEEAKTIQIKVRKGTYIYNRGARKMNKTMLTEVEVE